MPSLPANATADSTSAAALRGENASRSGIRSMTGQGSASSETPWGHLRTEVRTVNNRGFKCVVRLPEPWSGTESKIESVLRKQVQRGSVNVSVRLESRGEVPDEKINTEILASYIRDCQTAVDLASVRDDASVVINVAELTSLPGVLVPAQVGDESEASRWDSLAEVLQQAVADLIAMRTREGQHMGQSLLADCQLIESHVNQIRDQAPHAAEHYRQRLETKVKRLLKDLDTEVGTIDLLREVQIFADKSDVSEEITRLDGHLSAFRSVLEGTNQTDADDAIGRKLDFIVQEMFRETNTIGSKSPQSEVSAAVVEIKCGLERMRELVQNLE